MATSWGTRRALGRRYSTDPALLMELERLEKEYGLIPGREARALQSSQFDKSMEQQQQQFASNMAQRQKEYDETMSANRTAGMLGTGMNALTTAGILRAATMDKGEPFFGRTVTDYAKGLFAPEKTEAVAPYTQYAGVPSAGIPSASNPSFWTKPQMGTTAVPYTVNPAMMDATQAGISAGADVGMGTVAAPSVMSDFVIPGAQALGVYAGSRLLGDQFKEDTVANRALRDPVTGLLGEGLRGIGLKGAANQLNQLEEDIIQKPIEAVTDVVTNVISAPIKAIRKIFGGW